MIINISLIILQAEFASIAKQSGLTQHGEVRDCLKNILGMDHGDANAMTHAIFESKGARAAGGKSLQMVLDEIS